MAETLQLNPDGTIRLTVANQRLALRTPTVGELRGLRRRYDMAVADVEDHEDLVYKPAVKNLEKSRGETDPEKRKAARAKLSELNEERDVVLQGAWAGWWRDLFVTLCDKDLKPAESDDPAIGLEPWMVQSPNGIAKVFAHFRAVPTPAEGSGADPTAILTALANLNPNGG